MDGIKRIVITGCARSGTTYIAKVFNMLKIPFGHEMIFNPIKNNFDNNFKMAYNKNSFYGDSSWLAMPYLQYLNSNYIVLHQTRNPVYVIQSLNALGFFRKKNENNPHLKLVNSLLPKINSYKNITLKAMFYWCEWNKDIEINCKEKNLPYYQYQIEKIQSKNVWEKIKNFTQLNIDIDEAISITKSLPNNINGMYKDRDKDFYYFGLENLPESKEKQKMLEMAGKYGYSDNDFELH